MLLEFRFQNYKSFREETSFSMMAAPKQKGLDYSLFNIKKQGKDIKGPIMFQGGVAANKGIKQAFEEELKVDVLIPENFDVMGAIGAAILGKEKAGERGYTRFKGLDLYKRDYAVHGFECSGCSNLCEVLEIKEDDKTLARYGDKCGKWSYK